MSARVPLLGDPRNQLDANTLFCPDADLDCRYVFASVARDYLAAVDDVVVALSSAEVVVLSLEASRAVADLYGWLHAANEDPAANDVLHYVLDADHREYLPAPIPLYAGASEAVQAVAFALQLVLSL